MMHPIRTFYEQSFTFDSVATAPVAAERNCWLGMLLQERSGSNAARAGLLNASAAAAL